MGDADRGALEQFQLRGALDENGVARERSNLFWIEMIANGEHELHISVQRNRFRDRAKDVLQTVLQCSHGGVDKGFASQPFPWKIDVCAAGTIVERPSMVELRRPMRTLKVERSGSLGDPG